MPELELQPHVGLMRANWSVRRYRAAVLQGINLPALRAGDFPLVIFRRGIKMRHTVVHPWVFAILRGIEEGVSFGSVIEGLVADGVTLEALGGQLRGFFKLFAEAGWVQILGASVVPEGAISAASPDA